MCWEDLVAHAKLDIAERFSVNPETPARLADVQQACAAPLACPARSTVAAALYSSA